MNGEFPHHTSPRLQYLLPPHLNLLTSIQSDHFFQLASAARRAELALDAKIKSLVLQWGQTSSPWAYLDPWQPFRYDDVKSGRFQRLKNRSSTSELNRRGTSAGRLATKSEVGSSIRSLDRLKKWLFCCVFRWLLRLLHCTRSMEFPAFWA